MAIIQFTRTKTAMNRWGDILVKKLREYLDEKDLVASGKTKALFDHEVTQDGDIIRQEFSSNEKHGIAIIDILDTGRRPGKKPPVDAIEEWIKARGFQVRRKGKFVRNTPTNIKRAAHGIAEAIAGRGTIKRFAYRGASIYDKVFTPVSEPMAQDILDAYEADVNDYLDDNIKT